jgi:hypothetical protein
MRMADIFFGMSLWELTVVVLLISLAVGLGFSLGIRMLFRLKPSEQEQDVAINLMQVASTYIGILLAFAGVVVWQDYKSAQVNIQQEAATASQLYRDLAMYGPEAATARKDLRAYVKSIVIDEWPLLKDGRRSSATDARMLLFARDMAQFHPVDGRQVTTYQEAFSELSKLVELRRARLTASQSPVPKVLWVVALIGSILTIGYASAFSNSRYSSLMIAGVSVTIGLLFLFILSVASPFRGANGISAGQLAQLPSIWDIIDRFRLGG